MKDKKDSDDVEELKKITEDLSTKLMKVGEEMYKQEAADAKSKEAEGKDTEKDNEDSPAEEGEIVDDKKDQDKEQDSKKDQA